MKYDTAFACLRRLENIFGYEGEFTMRSSRAVFPTWPAQLGRNKEDRGALGRWAPNSEMPRWYVRAVCNAELRLRNQITERVQQGWKPSGSPELPKKRPARQTGGDASSVDSTSAVTSSVKEVNISDLGDANSVVSGYAPSLWAIRNPVCSHWGKRAYVGGRFPIGRPRPRIRP